MTKKKEKKTLMCIIVCMYMYVHVQYILVHTDMYCTIHVIRYLKFRLN